MITQLYFSPTGGTKKIMDLLAAHWAGERQTIDLSDPQTDYSRCSFNPDDICFAAVPSFSGRVPAVAAGRLSQISGNGARAILICVYGNRAYDDTLVEFQDILTKRGFCCMAAVAAVTEHSILRQFGAGRPDSSDRQELAAFAEKIAEKLEHSHAEATLPVPGTRPYRTFGSVPFHPKAGKECNGCGLCAAKCPVGAITLASSASVDSRVCISCMRCASVCPRHAIGIGKPLLFIASLKMKRSCSGRKNNKLFV